MTKRKHKANRIVHRPKVPESETTTEAPTSTIVVAPSPVTRKLDLACGQSCREGYEGVDYVQVEGVKHVVNLMKYPWPFDDSSVAAIHCSHYAEHIPAIEVDFFGKPVDPGEGQDALLRFYDELYRILMPDGIAEIRVPCGRSNRGFWDPTHRRFFMEQTFLYASKEWRTTQKLDHYKCGADLKVLDVQSIVSPDLNLIHPTAAARYMTNFWNSIHDFVGILKAIK
jgi:predicted SAM-dependent methyltransferase